MNYQAFTDDSLTMMYEAVRGIEPTGLATRFRVRETPDWNKHAADIESEMLRRGMTFDVIEWSGDQGHLPRE
jgi:hypothetical protein